MQELKIKRISDFCAMKSFHCGIEVLDDFIHNYLELCSRNHYCESYAVYDSTGALVALFALNFDSLMLDSDDIDDIMCGFSVEKPQVDIDYNEIFLSKTSYPALEVSYLAVDKSCQSKHIGSAIIEAIVDMARNQHVGGCQFLTVEALCGSLYSAVGFYERCLFSPCEYPNPNKDTLRMFRTLYPKQV